MKKGTEIIFNLNFDKFLEKDVLFEMKDELRDAILLVLDNYDLYLNEENISCELKEDER